MHRCASYTHTNEKDAQNLPKCIFGIQENWVWWALLKNLCNHHDMFFKPPFVSRGVMSVQKSLFDIVQPSTLRKPGSETDQGDNTQLMKCRSN